MKLKRMPFSSHDLSSPIFIILATFFMCGAVIGVFSSINIEPFSDLEIYYSTYSNGVISCFIDAVKFNLILIILSRFLGFLIPFFVLIRGYLLSFSISLVYMNSGGFFDKSMLFDSVLHNIVAIPCFLMIATTCFNLYFNMKTLKSKKARVKARFNYNYKSVFFLILLDFAWNIACMNIF